MAIISALPITLTNGQIADASQVMQDFNQIVNNVNTNAAENGTNSSITSLTGLTTALSVSQGGTGAKTQANAFINIVAAGGTFTGDANFNANCNINGTTTIAGNVTHTGTITANGNVTINRPVVVNNNTTITGTVVVNGNTTVNGVTVANGNCTISSGSTFTVTGVTIVGLSVAQSQIANSAVGQAQLKTTTTTNSRSGPAGVTSFTSAAGEYSFGILTSYTTGGQANTGEVVIGKGQNQNDSAGASNTNFLGGAATNLGNIGMGMYITISNYAGGAGEVISAQQRYITASPPYDLGDGKIPLFVFALVDKTTGNIIAVSTAIDPPWAHNGPTNIMPDVIDEHGRKWKRRSKRGSNALSQFRAGNMSHKELAVELAIARSEQDHEFVEIDQTMKQADMPLIPHPFISVDENQYIVILIESTGETNYNLSELHEIGENVNHLLHQGHVRIGNEHVGCKAPPGVMAVRAYWK